MKIKKKKKKKKGEGEGGRRGRVWGVRVDLIEELKSFLGKFTKKNSGGGGGRFFFFLFFLFFFFFWGGGFRVDVNEELKFLCKLKTKLFFFGGGGGGGRGGGVRWGVGLGSQDGCERRIEVFVTIQKKKLGGGRVEGGGGGVGGRGRVGGVRVDVNEELKFL